MSKSVFFVLALLTFGAGCVNSQTKILIPADALEPIAPVELSTPVMPAQNQTWTFQGALPLEQIENKQIRISTPKGEIVFELLPDVAPISVSNFVYLTAGGYYDGLTFHRVEKTPNPFVIQGGDPDGNGTGGPGYSIPAEFSDLRHERGMVAMARSADPNSAGSQFYITLGPAYFLDKNYTIFGRVLSGMEVVDQITVGDIMTQVTVEDRE